jgi:hypothetical protein
MIDNPNPTLDNNDNRETNLDNELEIIQNSDSASVDTNPVSKKETAFVSEQKSPNVDRSGLRNVPADRYREETSAELTDSRPKSFQINDNSEKSSAGTGIGITALVVSIISLFMMPVFLGIVGIVLGFIARGRGARSLGSWAIGVGALSIVVGIFIMPFF